MIPLGPAPLEPAPRPRPPRPAPPNRAAILLTRLIGYVIAWALILGLAMAACSAMMAPRSEPVYVESTLAPMDAPAAPTHHAKPAATAKPHRTAQPTAEPVLADPSPAWDCGDADPADPEIDPEWDCVPL